MASEDFDQERLQDVKDNIEQDQKLLKEYEDSLRYESDPQRRKQHEQNIDRLHKSISKNKQEYAELEKQLFNLRIARISGNQSNSSSRNQASPAPEHPPLLFNLLLQIDFQAQFELVQTAIDQHQIIGFLVHGESYCGQEILVNRLYRIKPNWQKQFPINIDVSSQGVGYDLSKLWTRLAEYLGMLKNEYLDLSNNIESDRILERICDRLIAQDVIITFSKVELMLHTNKLIPWLEVFWKPLVERARTIESLRETHLLMFLVDNCGSVCQSEVTLAEEFDPLNYNPLIPLQLPPASPFSLIMLKEWLALAIGLGELTMTRELTAQELYKQSENGIPQYVMKIICEHFGSSWEGEKGVAKWLI